MARCPSWQSAPQADDQTPSRLVSLDVFRGLTVLAMILVTNPGSYAAVYWPLLHAEWSGWTPADMIFPSFLFVAGVAITFSFASRIGRGEARRKLARHVVRRAGLLFALGLVLNAVPQFDLRTLRIPGVLQRISICYLVGGLLYLTGDRKRCGGSPGWVSARVLVLSGLTLAILISYAAVLKLISVPGFGAGRLDSVGNVAAYVDRRLIGTSHMWPYGLTPPLGVTYDPEGLLSTWPAIASLLIGILAGEWMHARRAPSRHALGLAGVGLGLLLLGQLFDHVVPINKKLWTSTFVLFSGGVSLVAFALCFWIVDLKRWRWWTLPALIFGTNAILTFSLANVLTPLMDLIHVGTAARLPPTIHQWGYGAVFSRWLAPHHASLAYAVAIVFFELILIFSLYRKRIFLRV